MVGASAAKQQNRADAAATILRWLIGDDDHVPVRTESPGELVGGFGDIVRSPAQIADILSKAVQGAAAAQRDAIQDRDLRARPVGQEFAWQDAGYLEGVAATLAWVLGERPGTPISRNQSSKLAARDLKRERLRADDVIEQARYPWMADRLRHARTAKASSSPSPGSLVTPPPHQSIQQAAGPTTQIVSPSHLDLGQLLAVPW